MVLIKPSELVEKLISKSKTEDVDQTSKETEENVLLQMQK